MKIWKLEADYDKYDNLNPVKEWSWEMTRSFDGRKKLSTWEPIEVERLEPEKGLDLADNMRVSTPVPIFSEKAKRLVEDLIGDSVEFLPSVSEEGKFWLVNVTTVLDCIDYEKSEVIRFKSSGRIMDIRKFVFLEEEVKNVDMFKIKEIPLQFPCVSDRFKELIESSDLTGFRFRLMWDSEAE
ncbi:MAG: hypothetical protein J6K04_08255 [Lachnospiraceae bacterium]|nr:hypothetical protein [Lachnospiraceae bacterium]